MSNSFNDQIRREIDRIKRRKKHNRMIASASAIIAVITMLASSMPATTATAKLLCGKEEHVHTEDCYETKKVLVCGHEKDGITKEEYAALAAKLPAVTSGDVMAEGAPAESSNAEAENKEEHVNVEPVSVPSDETTETTSADTTSSDSMGAAVDTSSQDASKNVSEESSQSGNSTAESSITEDTGNSNQTEPVNLEEPKKEENSSDSTNTAAEEEQKKEEASSSSDTASEAEASGRSSSEDHVVDGIDLDTVHVHTDSCYKEEKVLICGKKEHKHTEACYEQGGSITGSKDDAAITITYDAGELEKGTDVIVDALSDDDQNTVRGRINDELAKHSSEAEKKSVSAIYPYHITLMKDGETKTPEGLVDVSMQFANRRSSTDQNISWKLYYVTSDGIEDLTDDSHSQNDAKINTNDAGEVTDLSFKTDKFNIFVLAAIKTEAVEKAKEGKSSGTLTAEADGAKATLKYENSAVEEGTQLIISADSEKKASIQPLIEKSLKSSDSKQEKVVALYPYSLSLKKDGSTVQPAKEVEVTVDFTSALTTTAANGTWHVYHMDAAGQLEDVTDHADIQTDEIGAVAQIRFTTSSLSEYVIASIDTEEVKAVRDVTLTAEKDGIQVTVKADSTVIEDGTELVLTDDKYAKDDVVSAINKKLESENTQNEEKCAADVRQFGLSLVKDGKTISPNGMVSVDVVFTEKATSSAEKAQWRIYQLSSMEEAENVTDSMTVGRDEDNAVEHISFETKDLSDYALVSVEAKEIKETTEKLTAKADGVSVTITYETGALKDGTKLSITRISDKDEMDDVSSLISKEINTTRSTTKKTVAAVYPYEISLSYDGKKAEPKEGSAVQVEMSFDPACKSNITTGKGSWNLFHITGAKDIVELTSDNSNFSVEADADNNLTALSFQTDSFSEFIVASIGSVARRHILKVTANSEADFTDKITSVTFKKNGKTVASPVSLSKGEKLSIDWEFILSSEGLKGKNFTYKLDKGLQFVIDGNADSQRNDIVDLSGIKVGTVTISKDGTMSIHFNDDFKSGAYGNIHFECSYDWNDKNKGTTINFNDKGYVKIEKAPEDLTLQKSHGNVTTDGDNKIIPYNITVKSTTGTEGTITINDSATLDNFASTFKLDNSSIKNIVIKDLNGNIVPSGSYSIAISDNSFSISGLPQLSANGGYVLSYACTVPNLQGPGGDGSSKITNKASARDIGNNTTTPTYEDTYTTDSVIKKERAYSDPIGENTIEWVLTYVKRDTSVVTLNDTIVGGIRGDDWSTKDAPYDSNFRLVRATHDESPYEGIAIRKTISDGNARITIPEGSPAGTYKIYYTTTIPEDVATGKTYHMKNTGSDGGHSSGSETDYYKGGSSTAYRVRKDTPTLDSNSDDSNLILDWVAHVTVPDAVNKDNVSVDKLEYWDQFSTAKDNSDVTQSLHSTTTKELLSNIVVAWGNKSNYSDKDSSDLTRLIQGTDYQIYDYDGNSQLSNDSTDTIYGFRIKFKQSAIDRMPSGSKTISIFYQTKADKTKVCGGSKYTFKNKGFIHDDSSESQYDYEDVLFKKQFKSSDGKYSESSNTIEFNENDPYIYYRILVRPNKDATSFTITDTLSDGFAVDATYGENGAKNGFEASYYYNWLPNDKQLTNSNGEKSSDLNKYMKVSNNGSSYTITLKADWKNTGFQLPGGNYIALYYRVRIDKKYFVSGKEDPSKSVLVCNNTAKYNNSIISSTETTVESKVLSKFSHVNNYIDNNNNKNTNSVTYTIFVNPEAQNLVDGTDEQALVLTDTIAANNKYNTNGKYNNDQLNLKLDSVNLEVEQVLEDGTFQELAKSRYKLEVSDRTFTLHLPDRMALKITYTYKVRFIGSVPDPEISNTANLTGTGYSGGSSTTKDEVFNSNISASVSNYSLVLQKVDPCKNLPLSNVKFTITEWDPNSGKWITPHRLKGTTWTGDEFKELETDSNGKITITSPDWCEKGRLYFIYESENDNTGYESWPTDRNVKGYYFIFTDATDSGSVWKAAVGDDYVLSISNKYTQSKGNISKTINDNAKLIRNNVLYIMSDDTETVENTSTGITVTKLWYDKNGVQIHPNKTVQLKLQRKTANGEDTAFNESSDPQYLITVGSTNQEEANKDSTWTHTWTDLQETDNNGIDYQYYVKEIGNVSGYQVDSDTQYAQLGGGVTVINRAVEEYTLPSTGGNGPVPIVITGLVMTSLAALMYIYRRRVSGRGGAQ